MIDGEQTLLDYNKKVTGILDNIYDFIMVHYTLSNREDTDFWKDMQEIGRQENHLEMVIDNFKKFKFGQESGFPDFLWGQVAKAWGVDLSRWKRPDINSDDISKTQLYLLNDFDKHRQLSDSCENTYQWLTKNIYNS